MRFCQAVSAFVLLAASLPLAAATAYVEAPHARVELLAPAHLHSGENTAGLAFQLEPGWHIYWKNAGDAGEPPHVRWTLPSGIAAATLRFPPPKRLPLGPLMDYGYEDEVVFPIALQVAKAAPHGPISLQADVDWLVCADRCIPGKATLELNREVSFDSAREPMDAKIAQWMQRLPRSLPANAKIVFSSIDAGFRLSVETGRAEKEAVFFPEDQDLIDNPAPQKFAATAQGFTLDLKKDVALKETPKQLRGVLELSGGRAYEVVALAGTAPASTLAEAITTQIPAPSAAISDSQQTHSTQSSSLNEPAASSAPAQNSTLSFWRALGLAFLGGLILNLMPCVFPVLFLKGLALAQSGNAANEAAQNAAESLTARNERSKMRAHGLVYAAGILLSFWLLVGVLLGLRAAGAVLGWGFQFQSPVFLFLMASLLFFLGLSLAGQFEMGLTLTSTGGSFAQKQGMAGSFFTGVLAVIVATPCTAPFMGVALGYAFSQSAWTALAVFTALALGLAAPYVALTIQPAWTRLLPRPGAWMEILKQAASVPIFATTIWLAWVLARAYGATLLAALLAGFLLLAVAGWFLGRWPAKRFSTAVAGLLIVSVIPLAVAAQNVAQQNATQTSSEEVAWQPWSEGAASAAIQAGRPVFVDFTASWCLSCQVNERVALERPEVQAAFREKHVVLLKADWTRHDEAITHALARLGRGGVPAYAYYVPGNASPRLLPEALTPGIVLDSLK